MKLVDAATQLEREYANEKAGLEVRAAKLSAKELELKDFEKSLLVKSGELDQKYGVVSKKEGLIASTEQMVDREKAALEKERENNRKQVELRSWENKLAQIESRHEREKDDIAKAQKELSDEKETYKEKLKAEFMEQMSKRLSSGL